MSQNEKDKWLNHHREDADGEYLTTNQGVRISDNHNSLKAGPRGPTLMEDFIFREKMTHFDHERIPERIVHARGSGAHGYFQVYESMADYTKAAFLQDPSKKTPVFVRFSTVAGFRGSLDTARDARGFATKFYTEEGNFDLVGNNIPVFFIQDAQKFPDLVHSVKPEPHNEMPQASAAHDTFWDFISLMPESLHMIMWAMSDRAIPRSYRMMEGFGVHTFRLVNADGKARFVKFHWKPVLGTHGLVWDEAQKLGGKDPDYHRRDLWEAIEAGQFPEYELGVQIVEEEDEFAFDFDLLDATKIIPEELVPVQRIGKMVLDRNPDNFFAETEQAAFHPGHVVPGIDFSNDPLLQGRLFSYTDTQLIRLGGPNFAEIPINRPIAPVHNNQRDGYMRQTINKGRVAYEPNSLGNGCPMQAPQHMQGYVSYAEKIDAHKVRERSESFNDYFTQSTLFYLSQSKPEQDHIAQALQFELGKVEIMHIRERMVQLIYNIDEALAQRVADEIGVKTVNGDISYLSESSAPPPSDRRGAAAPGYSAALSMVNTVQSAKSRRVAILLAEGFNHAEVAHIQKALKDEGAMAELVSKKLGMVASADGEALEVKKNFRTTSSIMYDALYIPGGAASVDTLAQEGAALHFVNETYKHCKTIGATGDGVRLLEVAALPDVTLSDGGITDTHGVITLRDDASLDGFTAPFIAAIAAHRHWNREQPERVPA